MEETKRLLWKGMGGILIAIVTVIVFTVQQIHVPSAEQWSNNATLIVEVGVGIVITIVVLTVSKIGEKKTELKINTIQGWVSFGMVNDLQKKLNVYRDVAGYLIPMKLIVKSLINFSEVYQSLIPERGESVGRNIDDLVKQAEEFAKIFKESGYVHLDYFSGNEKNTLENILNEIEAFRQNDLKLTKLNEDPIITRLEKSIEFTTDYQKQMQTGISNVIRDEMKY